ncbi:ATP-dependent RNA helicase RhlE [Flavobacteriaceae bacterium MAR_2010_188]|nr:ATP-dependent RNA helicase RhlE [Flavobacteriaceae bacterium MAR_2010_188]
MSFESLGLSDELLKAVSEQGYTEPTPIQSKSIPLILERKDLLASAQTGTGKTAGFTLPMLQILNQGQRLRQRPIRALVLTPTRELAAQVYDNIRDYSKYLDIRSTVIFGGVNQKSQVRTIRNGVDILVATPGRLLDLNNQRLLSLANIEILVLDEADRMLDMGFLRDIKKIIALIPAKRQNLLFSATFSKDIKKLAGEFLHHPVLVEATPENSTVDAIEQKVYHVHKSFKTTFVINLIKDGDWQQVLVFTRTKHGANKLTKKMIAEGVSAAAIHGNKSQGARTKALAGFKEGSIRVMVATDIAARGLDIPLLPHVINFELPNISEDYVHRIGRTGRAGASGEAISLVSREEQDYLDDIEKLLGEQIPYEVVEGHEPEDSGPTKVVKSQGQGRGGRNSNSNSNRSSKSKSDSQSNRNRSRNKSRTSQNRNR